MPATSCGMAKRRWCDSASGGQCAVVDPIMDVPAKWLEMDGKVLDGRISIFGMVYNTNMLKKSEVPQSWEELLEPKWKGKITMVNPAARWGRGVHVGPTARREDHGSEVTECRS